MHKTLNKTKTEECKGFTVLEEREVTETNEVVRISKVDDSETPYPYIVERFKPLDNTNTTYQYYTGDGYETLEEAKANI